MTVRKILIFVPLFVAVFLLQSYLWVPTYEEQTRGNPMRLSEYITASIGDAAILNPTLSSDTASSTIEGMVFEGLIDRDEDLRFRGRLATSWEIYEEAFFHVNETAQVPGLGKADAEGIVKHLQEAKAGRFPVNPQTRTSLQNIKNMTIVQPVTFQVKKRESTGQKRELSFHVRAPAKIKLVLSHVDQELFKNLVTILGPEYFTSFPSETYVIPEGEGTDSLSAYAKEILPPTEHNPILVFYLRPNVKFHDGHVLDAHDVKFTYEAIMNPKNLSPRLSDYEPVKRVEVLDPLTVRIVYKRLYSPAIGSWAMGILPAHLLNKEALKKEAIRRGKDPTTFSMRQSTFNRYPIGCGPFVFREWK